MNAEAEKIIAQLGLVPLPGEGGFFRQTWVSSTRLANGRAAGSAIWFLITANDFSAFHRMNADEIWHFYAGDSVEHVQLFRPAQSSEPFEGLDPAASQARVNVLGAGLAAGQRPQLTVPGGAWQGARLRTDNGSRGWALLGCTVTPAWAEKDFELGERAILTRDFPGAAEWIAALTR